MAWQDDVRARLRSVNAAAGDLSTAVNRQTYWHVIGAIAEGMVNAASPRQGSSIVRAHVHELAPKTEALKDIDTAYDRRSPVAVIEALAKAGAVIPIEEQKGLEGALVQAFASTPRLWHGNPSAAWLALHRAEEDVLLICSDAYAGVKAVELKGRVSRAKSSDPTIADFQAFLAQFNVPQPAGDWPPLSAQARDWLRMILRHLNAAADQYQDQLRTWRNGLVGLTAAMTVSVVAIALVGFVSPYTVGVCGPVTAVEQSPSPTPSASPGSSPSPAGSPATSSAGPTSTPVAASVPPTAAPTASQSPSPVPSPTPASLGAICLDGGSTPNGRDWLFVLLFGLAGGLLSAVVTFRNIDSSANSYQVQLATTLSKIPLGVVVAAMGVFVLQRGLFDIVQPQSGLRILAFAFAFGFGQQAFTQALDSRTNALLGVATAQSSSGSPAGATTTSAGSAGGSQS
jgi:hypothetical protein